MGKSIHGLLFALLVGTLAGPASGALPAAVDGQPLPSLAPILERVTPAVVNIHTRTRVRVSSPLLADPFFRRFFDLPSVPQERINQSLGSGVIIDADEGLVLTNNHVIAGADEILVTLTDERTFSAELIGSDPDTDVALVRIKADDLTALPLSVGKLRVGDFVVAVGNPFGLGQTVTSGIVSALGRSGLQGLDYQNFIQTDASINPGNSGGALINLRGELVGINTAIFTPSGGNIGIGFAIPAALASKVVNQLLYYGEVRRGSIGVQVQDLTPDLAGALRLGRTRGAVVAAVDEDSPAALAGIESGDVIISVAGEPVRDGQEFANAEGLVPIGEETDVVIIRNGAQQTVRVTIDEPTLDEINGDELHPRLAGAFLANVPRQITRERGLEGAWLKDVQRGSVAWRYGLRPGDLIEYVNRTEISNLNELRRELDQASGDLMLQIRRRGQAYLVVLE